MADKSFGVKELNLLNASGTPTVTSPNNLNLNANTVAISTSCTIGSNLTVTGATSVANINSSGIATATTFSGSGASLTNLPAANLTGTLPAISGANLTGIAVTEAPVTDYTITANGTSAYRFAGGGVNSSSNNPDLYLVRGQKYRFNNTTGSSHPFAFRDSANGADYTSGISGSQNGIQFFTVPLDAPALLKYRCTIHTGNMVGNIYIRGAGGQETNVGFTTFTDTLEVKGSGGGTLKVTGSSAHTSKIVIADNAGTANGNCLIEGGDGTDFFTIQSNGNVAFENGKGINFGDTAGSGATSSIFDDYEEGSWTPNIRNTGTTATWNNQTGKYVKIGQQVTVWFNADGGTSPRSGGTSSSLIMTGLPFTQSMFSNPILGSVGANKSSGTGLYSTIGVIFSGFGQAGTQVRFGAGGQPINFGIDYVAGCLTYTAAS